MSTRLSCGVSHLLEPLVPVPVVPFLAPVVTEHRPARTDGTEHEPNPVAGVGASPETGPYNVLDKRVAVFVIALLRGTKQARPTRTRLQRDAWRSAHCSSGRVARSVCFFSV